VGLLFELESQVGKYNELEELFELQVNTSAQIKIIRSHIVIERRWKADQGWTGTHKIDMTHLLMECLSSILSQPCTVSITFPSFLIPLDCALM
jgi:hypothetical protein